MAAPPTFRDGVEQIVRHHLEWVEANSDRARFLYEAGQLDGDCEPMQELKVLNADLAKAYADWYRPFAERGEARMVKPGLVVAIVGGPAHEVCRRWLNGDRSGPLAKHTDELAYAAWAGLAGPEALAAAASGAGEALKPAPRPVRVRIEMLGADGKSLGLAEAELPPAPLP